VSANLTAVNFEDGANNLRIFTRTGADYTAIDFEFQADGVAFTYQGGSGVVKMLVPWSNVSYIEQVV